MVQKKGFDVNELRTALAELGETVPVLVAGLKIIGVNRDRNDAGDLSVNLQVEGTIPEAEVAVDEVAEADRRENDLSTLSEEERAELARLEQLGGVTDQRTADTGGEGDPL